MAAYPDAHFRHKEGCETFDFSFFFDHSTLRVSRNFNFSRRVTETIGEFQNRVLANLERTLSKKKKNKNKEDGEASSDAIKVTFRMDGEDVDSSSNCKDVLSSLNNVTMHVFDLDFNVVVNAPLITVLALPDSLLAGFPIRPSKLDVEFADRKDCHMTWFLSSKEATEDGQNTSLLQFNEVGRGPTYTPGPGVINHLIKLKCEPVNGKFKGPAMEVISKNVIAAGPGHCPFDTRHQFTSEYLTGPRYFFSNLKLCIFY